ncbi:MAG: GNAT family N-acetyltransferase [bacterium]|nr:GNAT family N-acetyltransferase [bacterium]MCP5068021.1 GNAT family N-acetyltransferase [bacterium]
MAELEMLEGVRKVPKDEWNALVGEGSPFLEWEWLASLEDAGCVGAELGWAPRPLVLREQGRLIAACPVYLKGNSEGEFVFDWGWADAAHRAGLEYYPKILVGVPFTPVTGARFLVAEGEDRTRRSEELAQALLGICEAHGLSGAHVNFCLDAERSVLEEAGFVPRLGFQYHWLNRDYQDFDDYLKSLRSKRRNQVRRERRELEHQGIEIEWLTGDDISDDLIEPMYRIYLSTIRNNPWGRQYLNRELFEFLCTRFRHRLCFVVARRNRSILAGAINIQKSGVLYGRYWGCFEELRHLHFNVCYYAGIEHCIENGLSRFEPGAGGQYKQLRGFDAYPTWSVHHLRDPRLADAVGRFLETERNEASAAIEWYCEHSANRRGQ